MLKNKIYNCIICNTKPDQISHHKSHIETQKHKDKTELFKFKLEKLKPEDLQQQFNTTNIQDIVKNNETIVYESDKKLNNTDNNDINYIELAAIMDENNIISNKEALKDKIHEIHNFLRNNGAGYGMNALKVFNIIYGLKKIEENNLLDKINLKKPDCVFSHLLGLANQNKDEQLAELIYGSVLDSISTSNIRDLLFYEIPRNMKSSSFTYLIKEINKITQIEKKCNVLLSGKIYEYFVGRDLSAISELGAYFTDRHIVDYIYDKLQPKLNEDKSIKSMIDMFGGSGGFTTGYINYLNKTHPKKINWNDELNKIYHYDMNEDVIKSAGLEFFCLTGIMPDMKKNLQYKNSFISEFNDDKYDLVITNPPYGGDKNKQSITQLKRDKIKNYIKEELKTLTDDEIIKNRKLQLKVIENSEKQEKKENSKTKVSLETCSNRINKFAIKNKLTGSDKEACSLILMMDMVKINGTCIGVLKEGVFFNKTYKNLRNCLINNFNVKEVISVPSDQFENTSTKTSIVIFSNTKEKTTEIKFSELIIERYLEDQFEEINNNIILTENKDDIKNVSDKLISEASLDELNENLIHSLNGKDYNKKTIICGKDYELKKLGDMCNCLTTTKYCTNEGQSEGKYRLYCSSQDKKLYVDFCEVTDYSIILGQGGNFNIHFDKNFTPSKHVCVIQSKKQNTTLLKYCYYIIPELQKLFITNGSTISWLNKTNIKNFDIPIPKSQEKITEWVNKISKSYDEKNAKQKQIDELELEIQTKIQKICENEECDEIELGNLCDIMYGKRITQKNNQGTKYDAYGGGNIMSYKVDEYNRSNITYKIARDGLSIHNCVMKLYGNIYLNDTALSLNSKDDCITNNYIGEFLLSKKEYIYKNCSHGSAQLHIDIERLMKLKISIPKNKKIIQNLEPVFEKIEILQLEVKNAELLYNKNIKELSEEAIPTNTKQSLKIKSNKIINDVENNTENITDNIAENKVQKTKIKKVIFTNSDDILLHKIKKSVLSNLDDITPINKIKINKTVETSMDEIILVKKNKINKTVETDVDDIILIKNNKTNKSIKSK